MGSKVTIELPDSLEEEARVLAFLRANGVRVSKEIHSKTTDETSPRASRWEKAAARLNLS